MQSEVATDPQTTTTTPRRITNNITHTGVEDLTNVRSRIQRHKPKISIADAEDDSTQRGDDAAAADDDAGADAGDDDVAADDDDAGADDAYDDTARDDAAADDDAADEAAAADAAAGPITSPTSLAEVLACSSDQPTPHRCARGTRGRSGNKESRASAASAAASQAGGRLVRAAAAALWRKGIAEREEERG
ncbi:unnamed protein product [Lampetra planeri]